MYEAKDALGKNLDDLLPLLRSQTRLHSIDISNNAQRPSSLSILVLRPLYALQQRPLHLSHSTADSARLVRPHPALDHLHVFGRNTFARAGSQKNESAM